MSRFLAAAMLTLFMLCPARGQENIDIRPNMKGGLQVNPEDKKPDGEGKPAPVGAYLAAIGSLVIVMLILCAPSRKS